MAEILRVPAPDVPILDSHCHAWRTWPYSPLVPDERTRGTVEQLLYEMDLHGVSKAGVVCAAIENNPDNIEYVSFGAERYKGRLFVVADLDCTWHQTYHRPGAADRLRALADHYDIVGVTHYVDRHNDGWLASEEAEAVFALAEELGIYISLAAGPAWQSDLRAIAVRHPGLPVLCHHLGGVAVGDEQGLGELLGSAVVRNIYVKVSGFHYVCPQPWAYPWSDGLGHFRRIFERFGPDRLCWGSDFPASTRHCTYRQALEVIRTHCDFLGPDERRLILGGTLQRFLGEGTP